MWSILNGTIVNTFAVIVGSVAGLGIGAKLPERYRLIVMYALGLVTLLLGTDNSVLGLARAAERFAPPGPEGSTYGARIAMVMIACLLVGAIIGTALRLEERIESVGSWIHHRFAGRDGHSFAEGFLTASVIFCVGPLTLLGCLNNGAHQDPSLLYIKSLLDGFCSLALAASLGWGVFASVFTVLGFQGGLSILAYYFAEPLDELSIALMTVVGGLILIGAALMILEIKRFPVANLLPGIFLPPAAVWLVERIHPGLLLPMGG